MTTVRSALMQATDGLARTGVTGAGTDARRILAHALDVAPARLSAMMDETLPDRRVAAFHAMIERRARRVPVAHIVGYREFWKHRFRVTPDVLDPRPETEALVARALEAPFHRVLDLGTGSGCILISLLLERPAARGVGTDVSERAVLVAGDNAQRLGAADRLVLPLSDWYRDIGGRFDLIVSNPPYIAASEMHCLQPEVRDWEPRAALTDEGDGLSAYRTISAGARDHLTPGGRIILEIGPGQGAPVTALLLDAGLEEIAVHPDLDGRDRVVSGRRPAA